MKIILLNLKSYKSVSESIDLVKYMGGFPAEYEIVVAPPLLSLYSLSINQKMNLHLCAQNFSPVADYGAHTGSVLIKDLKSLGCEYSVIGHSEVRRPNGDMPGETDALISHKLELCIKNNVIPVLCFGEAFEEKSGGNTENVVRKQLSAVNKIKPDYMVLAYEPVWAISSNKGSSNCKVGYVEHIASLITDIVPKSMKYKFLYGGSVDSKNISEYLSSSYIDGVLIGKASTEKESLESIKKELKAIPTNKM